MVGSYEALVIFRYMKVRIFENYKLKCKEQTDLKC